ncbi:HNH endonuclease signature motif containing protein [Arcicella aquatica]|uniref:HNH endonuclease signature motif containing protein n=1 Tax=Arcicella aquatica TaxID=217141 RepID=A0ABU5QJA0_9BACT|nr:HNH endonuclease signature motif containing protein [Arcicella aquatica]MEA5256855.1 HNH endonuclease signature motif containing protein [Arcicella aquatica]
MKKEGLPYIEKPEILSAELRRLYKYRISKKIKKQRKYINSDTKYEILRKSGFQCHICGEKVDENNFQADHISPHSLSGNCSSENFIAACNFCNNYRWNYLPEEIKWILKIGVWVKTQIEFETEIGKNISNEFIEHEKIRESRRKIMRDSLQLNPEDYPIREKIDYSKFKK